MSANALTTVFTAPASCASPEYVSLAENVYGKDVPILIRTECYPSGYSTSSAYSPGVCPSGYSTSTAVQAGSVTTAICCPLGMRAVNGRCWHTIETPTPLDLIGDLTTTATTGYIIAPAISIAWAASDVVNLATITPVPASPSSTDAAAHAVSSLESLSVGAIVGIAVGTGLVSVTLTGVAVWFILARKRSNQRRREQTTSGKTEEYLSDSEE